MRNMTLALGSFFAGVLCTSLGFGNPQTSMVLHSLAFAQTSQLPPPHVNPSVPKVPPLQYNLSLGNKITGPVEFDGRTSVGEEFTDATFVYGGGEYDLKNAKIAGTVNLELIGAARNTAQFLAMFGLIGCPSRQLPAPQADTGDPRVKKIKLNKPITGDFATKTE